MSKFIYIIGLALVLSMVVSCAKTMPTPEPAIPTGTPNVSVVDGKLLVTNSAIIYGVMFVWNYLDQEVMVYNDTDYRVHIVYGGVGLANEEREFYMNARSEKKIRHRIARQERVSIILISSTSGGDVWNSGLYVLGERVNSVEQLLISCNHGNGLRVEERCLKDQ